MKISNDKSKYTIYYYEETKTVVVYDPMPMPKWLGLKKWLKEHRNRYEVDNIILKVNGGIKWI